MGAADVLIITGGSRGIGLATIRTFLKHGFAVVNVSRTSCPIGDGVLQIEMDLENFSQEALEVMKHTVKSARRVTLIHNASCLFKDRVERVEREELQRAFAVNIQAPVQLNQWVLPLMEGKEGFSLLYVGSTLSEKAVSGSFSYVTTKHAQAGMMKATCQDLMGKGIHTALICPGATDTGMLRDHLEHDGDRLEAIARSNSFRRLVRPDEIAENTFFCCPESSY